MSMSSDPSDPKKPKDKPTDPKDPKNPVVPPKPKDFDEKDVGVIGFGIELFEATPWHSPFKGKEILDSTITVSRRVINQTSYDDTYEDNFLDMTHTLTVESGLKGSYGNVSASVQTKFSSTDTRIEKRHLQRIAHSTRLYDLSVPLTREELKQRLNHKFKADLETMSVSGLFQAYGSHVVCKIRMGGRAEYFCRTDDITSMTEKEFKAAAQAKYKSAGGKIQSNTGYGTTDKKKEQMVSGSVTINAIGGTSVGIKDPKAWDEWAKTVKANPGFLGFDPDGGLVPIWELTDNALRRRELHEAYKRKAAKAMRTQIISVTSEIASRPEAKVTVPPGYKLLSGGARNNWKGRGSFVTASYPEVQGSNAAARTWVARGKDHLGAEHYDYYWDTVFPDPSSITVFAIALYDPDDIWDVKHLYAEYVPPEDYHLRPSEERSWAMNPSLELDISKHQGPGGPILGDNGELVGGGTQVIMAHPIGNLLSESYPVDKFTWRSKAETHLMSGMAPTVRTYATVLKSKVEKIRIGGYITSSESSLGKQPKTNCKVAQDCVMTGGGAKMQFDDSKLLLTASFPSDDKTWEGRGKDHGYPATGTIKVYCFGVKVYGPD
jgi:hypothetical protein